MKARLILLLALASLCGMAAAQSLWPQPDLEPYLDVPGEQPEPPEIEPPGGEGILEEPDADSVVFVVDRSCSMGWGSTSIEVPGVPGATPWQAAQYELNRAIENLDGDSRFGVVLFNSSFTMWRGALEVADEGNKSAARGWVSGQSATGGTTYTPAVSSGINIGAGPPEVVMFLSDGAPNEGYSAVASIAAANGGRCIINTVAFGVPAGGSAFQIMSDIASQNGGEMRIVH
jgi:hypothetical protein